MISAFHLIYPFTFPSRVLLSLYLSNPSNPRFLFFLPTFYVINARKSPDSFFFLASLHLLWKKGGPLNVSLLLFPHPPSLSLPIRPIFLRSPFQRLFLRPSGVSSPIWINEPTLFPSSTSNCPSIRPVRDSPRNEPLDICIYMCTGMREILSLLLSDPFISLLLFNFSISLRIVFSFLSMTWYFFIDFYRGEEIKSSIFFVKRSSIWFF